MVGEQYLDLISAADAIIAMSKNAHSVQNKLDRMEAACDVATIRRKAAEGRAGQNEEGHGMTIMTVENSHVAMV